MTRSQSTAAEKRAKDVADSRAKVESLGNEIKVRIEKADKALVSLKEKAGRDFKDFVDQRASIAKLLAEAQEKCKAAKMPFETFRQKYAPNYSRSLTYELISIGTGRITIEDQREHKKLKKREERAAKNPPSPTGNGEPVRTATGDKIDASQLGPGAQAQLARATGNGTDDKEANVEARKVEMAKLAGEEPPIKTVEVVVESNPKAKDHGEVVVARAAHATSGDTKQIKKGSSAHQRSELLIAAKLYVPKLGLIDARGSAAEIAALFEAHIARLEVVGEAATAALTGKAA